MNNVKECSNGVNRHTYYISHHSSLPHSSSFFIIYWQINIIYSHNNSNNHYHSFYQPDEFCSNLHTNKIDPLSSIHRSFISSFNHSLNPFPWQWLASEHTAYLQQQHVTLQHVRSHLVTCWSILPNCIETKLQCMRDSVNQVWSLIRCSLQQK